jgi:hypothetical protein
MGWEKERPILVLSYNIGMALCGILCVALFAYNFVTVEIPTFCFVWKLQQSWQLLGWALRWWLQACYMMLLMILIESPISAGFTWRWHCWFGSRGKQIIPCLKGVDTSFAVWEYRNWYILCFPVVMNLPKETTQFDVFS